MEIRCDNCTHVGPAASVRPGPQGVVLECENCGYENVLDLGEADADGTVEADAEQPVEAAAATDEPSAGTEVTGDVRAAAAATSAEGSSFGDKHQVRQWLREDALEALIPKQGSGPRCRKCAWLLEPDVANCSRCGLNRHEADRYDPGEAPWEGAPAGKEAEHEQAELLWESFVADPDPAGLEKFVSFVRDEMLLDLGIRRLRFYLVDHPDDEQAVAHLRDLAESLQSRLIVAQVQAQADANEFQDEVSRFKHRVMIGMVVFWGALFLLFLALFWDNCSTGMPNW